MDVVTLGETMVAFNPKSTGYMRYVTNFSTQIAGAESNVAIGLARLGHDSAWMSRLGNDEFGKKILHFIRGEGVNVEEVHFDSSDPTGLYFKEMLTEDEMQVQYYRKNSAASKMSSENLNENYIANAKYLHLTGITPALSKNCYETVMHAIKIAHKHQVKVVFDPNVRLKLWPKEQAKQTLLEIAGQADIVLPGLDEGTFLFDEKDPEALVRRFYHHGARTVVLKLGSDGAYCFSDSEEHMVPSLDVKNAIDPVGAGDGFAAGFLSGLLDDLTLKKAVERGNAIGSMVTMVSGDVEGLPEKERLLSFVSGSESQDVNR